MAGVIVVVHFQTIVLQSVAHHEVIGSQNRVVSVYLIENGACERHIWRFIFDDDFGDADGLGIDHRVTPSCRAIQRERNLICHERGGIAQTLHEKVCEMLPHPFLRRERYETVAEKVVY